MIIKKKIGTKTSFAGWGRFLHFLGVKQKGENYVSISLPFNTDSLHLSTREARELRNALTEYLEA
jgi:hypothetical protein